MQASEIWHNGLIETMVPSAPTAQAFAIDDKHFVAVGSDTEILNLAGPGTIIHNLHGRYVMPGIVESHTHALWGACSDLFDISVGFQADLDQLLDAVRERSARLAPGTVIFGGPWRLELRNQISGAPRALLDQITTEHPVILHDVSQHILWCNSHALELSGITHETEDIPGGVIERDSNGAPNGILAEAATAAPRELIKRTEAQMAEATRHFVNLFNSLGITAFKEPMAYDVELDAYKKADERQDLKVHMAAHIVRSGIEAGEPIPYDTMENWRAQYASENIRTDFAKLFLDGVPLGLTGSFIDPYEPETGYDAAAHDPDATLLINPEILKDTVTELDRRGFVTKMHAVGDNAIRKGLDAIEAARARNGNSGLRHEIAHTNFLSDQDVPRFAKIDAVAEMSPKLWFPGPTTKGQIHVVGRERLNKAHRFKDLLAASAEMTYASDWPAAAPNVNPWIGLAGMISRRDPTGMYEGSVGPEQAISLKEALSLFTSNGARALKMGAETGSISAGKWADFIILDRNLHDCTYHETGAVEVQQTFWKGQPVFGV